MSEQTSERVGFCRPPIHTRFRKGTSGNPKGRPKEELNLVASFVALLDRKVSTTSGKTYSAREAVIRSLIRDASHCKSRAFSQYLQLAKRAGFLKPIEAPIQTGGTHYILRGSGLLVPAAQYDREKRERKQREAEKQKP